MECCKIVQFLGFRVHLEQPDHQEVSVSRDHREMQAEKVQLESLVLQETRVRRETLAYKVLRDRL